MLHDNLNIIGFLKNNLKDDDKLVLGESKILLDYLTWFDSEFVEKKIIWIKSNDVILLDDCLVTVPMITHSPFRSPFLSIALKQWSKKRISQLVTIPKQRTIIYYSRKASNTFHGRIMDDQNEKQIITKIQYMMRKLNRKENLVIFNGEENMRTMSFSRQCKLFSSAKLVIGSHGSGMVNVFYMQRHNNPKVIEFVPGKRSLIQGTHPYGKTYYNLWSGLPWIEYCHIPFTKDSTKEITKINIKDLENAMGMVLNSK